MQSGMCSRSLRSFLRWASLAGGRGSPGHGMPRGQGAIRRPFLSVGVLLALGAAVSCTRARPTTANEGGPQVPEELPTLRVEDAGLRTPSAIMYDRRADVYLVANVNGAPPDHDGNGFISRVRPDGKVETLRWIEGGVNGAELNAPTGMALRGDTLFVADVNCVRLFLRTSGAPAGSVCPPGARRLFDLTLDVDGVLWATDSGDSAAIGGSQNEGTIFAIRQDGAVRPVLRGADLGRPRGIAASERGVFFTTLEGGNVSQVTPTGARRVVGGQGWQLDGIVFLPDGSFAFSNRSDSTVLFVRAKDGGARGDVFTLVRKLSSAGVLSYDPRRTRVLIPEPAANRLLFVDVWP